MLSFEGICKSFGPQRVLWNVSGEAEGFLRVAGPSGCGKTTLLRILMGLETPDSGTMTRKGQIAAVFQEDRLCPQLTAEQNIRLVCRPGVLSKEEMQAALHALALEGDMLATPAEKLSGGQRRRVALARALLAPAENLILDEPFTGLDEENLFRAMEFTRERAKGRTLILATHDPAAAAFFGGPVLCLGEID